MSVEEYFGWAEFFAIMAKESKGAAGGGRTGKRAMRR
jgi:hypothetical protein